MPMPETRAEKWERTARLLKAQPNISNCQAARRLGLYKDFVRQVRADLGLPVYRQNTWTQAKFDATTMQVAGGHRLWLGRWEDGRKPMAGKVAARRLSYRLQHGREPVGRVEGTCTRGRCVAGDHLEDDVLRAAQPGRLTLHGMDLVAIRTALRGEPPYPALGRHEQRMAFRLADPALGVVHEEIPVVELARRLGCADNTVRRWRDEGVPV
ncbi:hypothetical protein [Streptomyces misionensis]|uniref:hypothetical protein n=1 Tax=Streptomyces misionensis TaxID=67331 RepID=UPI0033ADEE81